MKKVFLIDANSLIHRAYHALPPLTSSNGEAVQAVYGVASILLKLWKEDKPQFAAALFDRPEPTFRKNHYALYKAQRPAAPSDLISQIIESHKLFEAFGIPTYELAGWEADDLIATLSRVIRNNSDAQVVILTGDLDALQLVTDNRVIVRALRTGISDTFTYNESAVRERFGLSPGQLPDYKALVGDPSDNVKGVPGIGPKTASLYIGQFGTLENLYSAAEKDEKIGKKILPFKKEAELSKMLVTLRDDAPLEPIDLNSLFIKDNTESIKKFFEEKGFRVLLKRIGVESLPEPKIQEKEIAETIPIPPHSFADASSSGDELRSQFLKVGFDLKNLLKENWKKSHDCEPPYFDLGVASWLIDSDAGDYSAGAVSERFFKTSQIDREKIFERCFSLIKMRDLSDVFEKIEMPLLRILGEMEFCGVALSRDRLRALLKKIDGRLSELTDKIYKHAGEAFNLNSPREVSRILFSKLGIISKKSFTKTGLKSTREETLLTIIDSHPIVRELLEYREFFKVRSTYLVPLLNKIGIDGRVHTEFIQTGTGTGRLSSRDPNLQNIPQNFVWSGELRSAFVSSKGWSFAAFDYTQMELRILAALSKDEELINACRRGDDLHRITASKVLGIPPESVDHNARRLAKTLNFGLAYGMGARSFAEAAGIPLGDAKKFMEQYFKTFSKVKEWQSEIRTFARQNGYVLTRTGRRRYLPQANSSLERLRSESDRAAVNHPVQGLAADIMKTAMIRVRELIKSRGWEDKLRMLLTIHDELLCEVRDDMIEEIIPVVRKTIESAFEFEVPLLTKASIGKDWGTLETISK